MNVISVKNLKKYFGETKAVDGVSFEVKKGEIFGFLGPNGAGKTTTIRCILDFLKYDSGSITILEKDSKANSSEIKRAIGFLSGEVHLYRNWTGREHIQYVSRLLGIAGTESNSLAKRLKLDISKRVKDLSSENKQKLAFLLALIGTPEILILDEPTNSLDPLSQIDIYKILQEKAAEGVTIFMSSHVLSEVEKICDRVCIIKSGKVVAIEDVSKLKQKRVYQITVTFDKEIDVNQLNTKNIAVKHQANGTYILKVTGNISNLINKLSGMNIKDIEISQSNLEQVFLEYYK